MSADPRVRPARPFTKRLLSQLGSIGGMFDHSGHPPAVRENGDHVSPIAATATSALPQLSAGNGSHRRALQ